LFDRGQKNREISLAIFIVGVIMIGTSCSSIPKGATAIQPFDSTRYLGKWYEIARFDFTFEKNLNNTTAEYSLNSDGTIRVENTGYNYKKGKWVKAIGRAIFRETSSIAKLGVSFFGPFYAGYNVIMLDNYYKYALIAGQNLNYLWILSRDKFIPDEIKKQYLFEAERLGFKTQKLIWVDQNKEK
jgi:apolipoprotein D and lipocalin family protein